MVYLCKSHKTWNPSVVVCVCVACSLSPPFPPKRSSETHFQTTFFHFAKQEFPLSSPQTPPEPVNSPYFNNFLETNHAPYPPAPPVLIPYRRTRTAVFSAGQSWCCPKKLLQGVIGRRCAVRKTIGYGWSWIVICTLRTGAAIALMAGRASIWQRCGMRRAIKLRITSRQNPTRWFLPRADF